MACSRVVAPSASKESNHQGKQLFLRKRQIEIKHSRYCITSQVVQEEIFLQQQQEFPVADPWTYDSAGRSSC